MLRQFLLMQGTTQLLEKIPPQHVSGIRILCGVWLVLIFCLLPGRAVFGNCGGILCEFRRRY